jgi:hypothetical protein
MCLILLAIPLAVPTVPTVRTRSIKTVSALCPPMWSIGRISRNSRYSGREDAGLCDPTWSDAGRDRLGREHQSCQYVIRRQTTVWLELTATQPLRTGDNYRWPWCARQELLTIIVTTGDDGL